MAGIEERPGAGRRQLLVALVIGLVLSVVLGVLGGSMFGRSARVFGAIAGLVAGPVKVVEAVAARRVRAGAWSGRRAALSIFFTAVVGLTAAVVQAIALPGFDGAHEALATAMRTLRGPGGAPLLVALSVLVLLGGVVHVVGAAPSRGVGGAAAWGAAPEVEPTLLGLAMLVVTGNALVVTWLAAGDGPGVAVVVFMGLLLMQPVAALLGVLLLVAVEEAAWRFIDLFAPED